MKKLLSILLIVVTLIALVGCTGNTDTNNNKVDDDSHYQNEEAVNSENKDDSSTVNNNEQSENSQVEEIEQPTIDETTEQPVEQPEESKANEDISTEIFKGNSYDRAFKTLDLLDISNENIMISPLSIEQALAMINNGLNSIGQSEIISYLGQNVDELNRLNKEYIKSKENDDVLFMANSLWIKEGLEGNVNTEFKNKLITDYSAELDTFDKSPNKINSWVSDKTNGMITSIVDSIPDSLRALLVNAVYFNGKWEEPFEDWQIVTDYKFKTKDNEEVEATFLSDTVDSYMENSQATAFRKKYNDGYSFIGILPKNKDKFDIENFNMNTLLESETYKYEVDIMIPKFESEYSTSLVGVLKALGLNETFKDGALDKVINNEGLIISDIVHKTAIKLDEKGTEASAVTGIMCDTTSIATEIPERKEVILDRPFVYTIMDDTTNQILFIGIMKNPS